MSNQSGIAFTHCAFTAAAAGTAMGTTTPTPSGARSWSAGKRVKTVDIHAHCCVPKAMAVINHPLEAPGLLMEDTSTRIAAMDAQGIDVEASASIPTGTRPARTSRPS